VKPFSTEHGLRRRRRRRRRRRGRGRLAGDGLLSDAVFVDPMAAALGCLVGASLVFVERWSAANRARRNVEHSSTQCNSPRREVR
jgi:hypothetical protein